MTIEKTDPAPSPATAGASGGQRVRHKKRGTIYRVIGVGELQSDTELSEGARIVAYRCETDGRLWLRPQSEFEDGRFEPALAMTDAAWAKRAADREEGHEVSAGIAPAPSPAPARASDVSELVERLKRSAKEALSADHLSFDVLWTRCDLWAGDMSSAATALSQQAAEIERLNKWKSWFDSLYVVALDNITNVATSDPENAAYDLSVSLSAQSNKLHAAEARAEAAEAELAKAREACADLGDVLPVMARAHDRIHCLPRATDTELADALERAIPKVRRARAIAAALLKEAETTEAKQ